MAAPPPLPPASTGTLGTKNWAKHGSGYEGGLSAEQAATLVAFKAAVPAAHIEAVCGPHETHDLMCLRFLRARQFDVPAAAAMLASTAAWHAAEHPREWAARGASACLGCEHDELIKFYRLTYVPTADRDGRPLYVEACGDVNIDGVLMVTDETGLVRFNWWELEAVQAHMFVENGRKLGRPVGEVVTILDLEGLTAGKINQRALNFVKLLAQTGQNYYPETMGKMFIINAPTAFTVIWTFLKPFLHERTQAKVEILGGRDAYLPRLLTCFDIDAIPVEFGGKLAVPGGIYPVTRTKDTVVASGQVLTDEIAVTAGMKLRVRWFVWPGNLVWGMTFVPAGGAAAAATVLHEAKAYPDCGTKMVQIEVVAPGDGVIRSTWDNKAGWRERVVYHRHDAIGPDAVAAAAAVSAAVSGVAVAHAGETPGTGAAGGSGGGGGGGSA